MPARQSEAFHRSRTSNLYITPRGSSPGLGHTRGRSTLVSCLKRAGKGYVCLPLIEDGMTGRERRDDGARVPVVSFRMFAVEQMAPSPEKAGMTAAGGTPHGVPANLDQK